MDKKNELELQADEFLAAAEAADPADPSGRFAHR